MDPRYVTCADCPNKSNNDYSIYVVEYESGILIAVKGRNDLIKTLERDKSGIACVYKASEISVTKTVTYEIND